MELTAKMNPVVKTKWVAALRSGQYRQGTGYLCDAGINYCCLGVLAATLGYAPTDLGEETFLTINMMESSGLTTNDPIVQVDLGTADMVELSRLNDEEDYSFYQIADLIEAQL